jgi:hypothetical protein
MWYMAADLDAVLQLIREKRERLESLQRQVAILQAELRQIESATKGRPITIERFVPGKTRPKSRHGFTNGKRARPIQPGSSVAWTRKVLSEAQKPLTVEQVIARIAAEGGPDVKKPTLVSNLSRYVQHHDTFRRVAPNTYGLISPEDSENKEVDIFDALSKG